MRKHKLVNQIVLPLIRSLFFSAAMSALLWITVNYGTFNVQTLAIGAGLALYSFLTVCAAINLAKGDNFLNGSSVDVLSVPAQKAIRIGGFLLALPALFYTAAFAFTALTFSPDEASLNRVTTFHNFEVSVFGKSVIYDYLKPVCSVAPAIDPAPSIEPAPTLEAQADVDFGPYMASLQRTIRRAWTPSSHSVSQRMKVQFKVHSEGNISDLQVAESSGNAAYDEIGLKAVEEAAPFRHLPEGAPENVDILFSFDYNVEQSNGDTFTGTDTFSSTGGDAFSAGTDTFSTSSDSAAHVRTF